MSRLGNWWVNLEFSQRKHLWCSWVAHSKCTLQFSQRCDSSVPGMENLKRTKPVSQRFPWSAHSRYSQQCSHRVSLLEHCWEYLECADQGNLWETGLVLFKFSMPGTLESHRWEKCKVHFEWATQEHHRGFLGENSRFTHWLPRWDIKITWHGKLPMY